MGNLESALNRRWVPAARFRPNGRGATGERFYEKCAETTAASGIPRAPPSCHIVPATGAASRVLLLQQGDNHETY
jgi:hypothetical protein